MDISGRVAVVTGASSGIGAAVARDLAGRGARVVAVARRPDRLAEVVEACRASSPDSVAHPADVGRREDCEAVVAGAEARFGRVDIVVNNAGISIHREAARTTPDDIAHLFAVNFFGPVHLTMAALPGMLDRGCGSVVNVTSVAGYVPNPGESAYGASKAALSRWSHGLAVELHGTGVHVGTLSPGPIDTEIWSLDEVVTYHGKLYPPSTVAAAVARMIEREQVHVTSPRGYGAVGALYPLLGRAMRWGMRRFERANA
jgi:NAD(P)-dependent dehydrogenase (short-subunit alcohol dehydrogenase family)